MSRSTKLVLAQGLSVPPSLEMEASGRALEIRTPGSALSVAA